MLRAAQRQDAPALAEILRQWIDETPYMPRLHTAAADRAFVSYLIADHHVLVSGGETPTGWIARKDQVISHLFLAPDARGRGLGSAMIDAMKARRDLLSLWCFQANVAARRFYTREGFVEIATTDGADNTEKLPDVKLEWRRQA
ncbi:MAG: GNAT family N-acetyltransferase [Pseudomonadota bacterium]